jgi:mannosyltransferase
LRQIDWIDAVSLFLPLVALAFLAVRGIDAHSLWRDEIASVVAAKHSVGELVVIVGRDREKVDLPNMASYYLVLHFWLWLGETEARIRALSLLAAVATVVPVYLLARRIGGRTAAAVAAGVFALHPFVIVYSMEARGYALSMLVVATLTLLLVVGVEGRSPWAWLAYGIVAALGIYVHLFVVLTIGAHGLWALATRSLPSWRLALLAAVPIAVAAAPLPAIAAEYGGSQDWIDPISLGQVAVAITVMAGGALVLIATGTLSAAAAVTLRRDRRVWLLVGTLLVPIVGAVLISFVKPLILARYFVVCLPPLATLAGVGAASLRPGMPRAAAIGVLAGVMVVAAPSAYRDRHEQDWRSLGSWIASEARPGDRLVVRQWGEQPVTYYLGREGARRWPVVATARYVMNHPTTRVWLVLSVEPGVPEDAVVEQLEATHDTVERRAFGERVTALLLVPSSG